MLRREDDEPEPGSVGERTKDREVREGLTSRGLALGDAAALVGVFLGVFVAGLVGELGLVGEADLVGDGGSEKEWEVSSSCSSSGEGCLREGFLLLVKSFIEKSQQKAWVGCGLDPNRQLGRPRCKVNARYAMGDGRSAWANRTCSGELTAGSLFFRGRAPASKDGSYSGTRAGKTRAGQARREGGRAAKGHPREGTGWVRQVRGLRKVQERGQTEGL